MGVTKRSNGRFQARYTKEGKRITVGTFDTVGEAREALAVARGGIYVSQEALDKKEIDKMPELEIPNRELNLHPPYQPTLWDRFTTWLRQKVN